MSSKLICAGLTAAATVVLASSVASAAPRHRHHQAIRGVQETAPVTMRNSPNALFNDDTAFDSQWGPTFGRGRTYDNSSVGQGG